MDEVHPNGSNGYARIREVYALFREQDERFDKRLREMEDRLTLAISEMRKEQSDNWKVHESDSADIRSRLTKLDEDELAKRQYEAGKAATFRSIDRVSNWIENHWKTLSFLVFIVLVLLNALFDVSLLKVGIP